MNHQILGMPPPFPDPIAAALGHLMVGFQGLELTLVIAISQFMHPGNDNVPPNLTFSVLRELPFASLVKLFASIPHDLTGPDLPFSRLKEDSHHSKQLFADFASAAMLCTVAQERRNQLMHSNWLQPHNGIGDETMLRVKVRTSRKKGPSIARVFESVKTVSAAINATNVATSATFVASATLKFFLFPNREDAG